MLYLLLSLLLSSQVTIEVEPALPKNELPPSVVKIDSPCDVVEKSCRESAIAAQKTMQQVRSADWDSVTNPLRAVATKTFQKGVFTGQIGFYHTLIADLQLRMDDDEAAIESYRSAKKHFIEADELFLEVLEIIAPPVEDIGV